MLPTNFGSFEIDELDDEEGLDEDDTDEERTELELAKLLELDPGVGVGTPQAASDVINTAEQK